MASGSVAQEAEVVEWEFLSKDGVAERRHQPQPQVLDVAAAGLPLPIIVESEVLGSGPGKIIDVEQLASEGIGGRPLTRNFDMEVGEIAQGPDDHIWVATAIGICRYNGKAWTLYTAEDGLRSEFVWDMEFDPAGHLWMAGTNGVTQFDGQRWIWHPLSSGTFRSIAVSPNGNVWTGGGHTIGVGEDLSDIDGPFLYRFDGTDWREYSSDDGLPIGAKIHSVDVDKSGIVWIGIPFTVHNLISFDETQFIGYRPPHGALKIFVDSKDRVWMGSGNSLFVKDGPDWGEYPSDEVGNWGGIRHIYEDRFSRLWLGGGGTWGTLEGAKWSFQTFEPLNGVARGFLVDRQGFHWVSFSSGSNRLLRWRPSLLPANVEEGLDEPSPTGLQLNPNYPNPFNAETIISFWLPYRQPLSLEVLNLSGQVVDTLMEGPFLPGYYAVNWDGRNSRGEVASSGFYVYRLSTKDRLVSGKMTLLK